MNLHNQVDQLNLRHLSAYLCLFLAIKIYQHLNSCQQQTQLAVSEESPYLKFYIITTLACSINACPKGLTEDIYSGECLAFLHRPAKWYHRKLAVTVTSASH